MQSYFYELADYLTASLHSGEVFTAYFTGEDSDFVRFNRGKVRQAGSVLQRSISVDLIDGQRHAAADVTLTGQRDTDCGRLAEAVTSLRETLQHLPDDPHLLYNTQVSSSEDVGGSDVPAAGDVVEQILAAAQPYDFVGIYAAGTINAGFASSLGQRNWYARRSFNLDWSLYRQGDKAVKSAYAGLHWDADTFAAKMAAAAEQLEMLGRAPKQVQPGGYRAFLAPAAMAEVLAMLGWGGFGLKSRRTKQTPLIRMAEEGARLHPSVTLAEHTAEGVGPSFGPAGFLKAPRVALIDSGALKDPLVSPRSAREFDLATNGASSDEAPRALFMNAGTLPQAEVLQRLGTGVYINNLWYLNYSDRRSCRITGMTRFATLWVEHGRIAAPLSVMRFDDSIYRLLGDALEALTVERDFILDADTYGRRSTACAMLPGALVRELTFTL